MINNKYKIFFTISFFYNVSPKKTITKFFKSDLDIRSSDFSEEINDANIYEKCRAYALKKDLSCLNPSENYIEAKVMEKKITIHRIVNLTNITEVFLS